MVQLNGFKSDTKHAKVEPEEFTGNTLGGKFGNTIIRLTKKIVNSITDWFEERLINFAIGVLVKVETSGKTVFGSLIKELKSKNAIPEFMKPIFDEIEDPKHEVGALLGQSAGSSAIGGLFGALFDPLMANVKYGLNSVIEPYIPGIGEAVAAWRRGDLTDKALIDLAASNGFSAANLQVFKDLSRANLDFSTTVSGILRGIIPESLQDTYLKRFGFDDPTIKIIKDLYWKLPSVAESISAHFRGKLSDVELREIAKKNGIDDSFLDILITANRQLMGLSDIRSVYFREGKPESWLDLQLGKLGYDKETVIELKKILPYFPAVPDLIKFAVREVYSPDIVAKYGQLEDLPPKFIEEAKKAGLPEDQAKNFWAAHWILPAFGQGAEMLHRGVIPFEGLKELLRTLDVMPYWRDKLIEIAYTPLTRVDVRRMYNMGIINEEQVLKAYKDIGYNDENAAYMTDFTLAYYQQADKTLTRSNIEDGYRRAYFSTDEAIELLRELGYDEVEAEFYIAKADYTEEVTKKKEILKLTEDSYKKAVLSDNDVISLLGSEGFKASEVEYHLSRWSMARKATPAKPEKTELKNWLKKKIISREDFIDEMRSLGFSDKYLNYYLKELGLRSL